MLTLELGPNISFTVMAVGIVFAIAWVRTHRK
jgi:uncharacterized membrane protein